MQSGTATNLIPFPAAPDKDCLQAVAERVRVALEADGTAIALSRDGEIVCQASVGAAPAVGTRLDAGSTLSSRCLRTQVPVVHTERPGRNGSPADSYLLVPVVQDSQAIGLCIAFAARESAFSSAQIAWLMEIAESVAKPRDAAAPPTIEKPLLPRVEAPTVEPLQPEIAPPAPPLDAETLRGVEEEIALFERAARRRARVALVLKAAGVAVLLCVTVAAFVPERVAAWVGPIVKQVEQKFEHRPTPRHNQ